MFEKSVMKLQPGFSFSQRFAQEADLTTSIYHCDIDPIDAGRKLAFMRTQKYNKLARTGCEKRCDL